MEHAHPSGAHPHFEAFSPATNPFMMAGHPQAQHNHTSHGTGGGSGGRVEDTPRTFQNLYVNKLPAHFTDTDLLTLFAEFGPERASVMIDPRTGTSKGFGFVLFHTEDDGRKAHTAITRRRNRPGQLPIDVFPSRHDAATASAHVSTALFIRNIPLSVPAAEVEKLVRSFGALAVAAPPATTTTPSPGPEGADMAGGAGTGLVEQLLLRPDREGAGVWLVYAEYASQATTDRALTALHGNRTLFDRPVVAKYADAKLQHLRGGMVPPSLAAAAAAGTVSPPANEHVMPRVTNHHHHAPLPPQQQPSAPAGGPAEGGFVFLTAQQQQQLQAAGYLLPSSSAAGSAAQPPTPPQPQPSQAPPHLSPTTTSVQHPHTHQPIAYMASGSGSTSASALSYTAVAGSIHHSAGHSPYILNSIAPHTTPPAANVVFPQGVASGGWAPLKGHGPMHGHPGNGHGATMIHVSNASFPMPHTPATLGGVTTSSAGGGGNGYSSPTHSHHTSVTSQNSSGAAGGGGGAVPNGQFAPIHTPHFPIPPHQHNPHASTAAGAMPMNAAGAGSATSLFVQSGSPIGSFTTAPHMLGNTGGGNGGSHAGSTTAVASGSGANIAQLLGAFGGSGNGSGGGTASPLHQPHAMVYHQHHPYSDPSFPGNPILFTQNAPPAASHHAGHHPHHHLQQQQQQPQQEQGLYMPSPYSAPGPPQPLQRSVFKTRRAQQQ